MNERQRRAWQQLRDDQAVVRAAARRLRDPVVYGDWAGLDDPRTAELLAGLLDYVADELEHVCSASRHATLHACRDLVGDRMDQPTIRRTRRRR